MYKETTIEHPKQRPNGCVHDHILIAESKLRRHLKQGEVVHHVDENKHNNNPENIVVFISQEAHARFHKTNVMIETEEKFVFDSPKQIKTCCVCGIELNTKRKGTLHCAKCYSVSRRTVERPTKEILFNLLKQNSFIEVGKMYSVSDNAIRKWCRFYKIPDSSKYYK